MPKTLLTRIRKLEQYDQINKTITWDDPTQGRWDHGAYGQLEINDNIIFIAPDKLLIGTVTQLNKYLNIVCSNVSEETCSNDQLLQLHEIYPELISRVKASFQPFIHPQTINTIQLIADADANKYVSYYIVDGIAKFNALMPTFKVNDRITIINANAELENVKLFSGTGLVDFSASFDLHTSVEGMTLDEMLEKNKSIKRKSAKSNNVTRIENIKKIIAQQGVYKFNTFFSYYDCQFNKRVYGSSADTDSVVQIIRLATNERVYKISMSGKDIDKDAFDYFNERNLVVVHADTKAKGQSSKTQGNIFAEQMQVGDYFYLCRGNNNLELIGRITGDGEECEYEDYEGEGWLQRSYDLIAEPLNEDAYFDDQKWWTPNNNSTCIAVPVHDIDKANSKLFIPFFNREFEYEEIETPNTFKMNKPLNQILFGPPGTGKTYELLENYIPKFTLQEKKIGKREFEFKEISSLPWWKVIALILVADGPSSVPDIKKHAFLKYKLEASETNSLDQTLWGQLSSHTIQESVSVNYAKRAEPSIFDKDEKSIWHIVDSKKELIKDVYDLSESIKNYKEEIKSTKNFSFITFHQSSTYEDFIEGIKPKIGKLEEDGTVDGKISYHYEDGLFYKCCDEAARLAGFLTLKDCIENYSKKDRVEKFKEAPAYAIFIDEINRGNISAIFGELITLIEEDKRLSKNEVIVELPYSKRKFAVPPNLHIIGTMNTADRSVEALDAALRRRFSFEEMLPKPALIDELLMRKYVEEFIIYYDADDDHKPWKDYEDSFVSLLNNNKSVYEAWDYKPLRKLIGRERSEDNYKGVKKLFADAAISFLPSDILKIINLRIEKLLDKDHQIGHSYFMGVKSFDDLKTVFQNNIIPLLQEYFFGSYEKIGMVLGKGFVKTKEWDKAEDMFADFDSENIEDYADKEVYEIINYYNPDVDYSFKINDRPVKMNFEKAIKLLLREKIE